MFTLLLICFNLECDVLASILCIAKYMEHVYTWDNGVMHIYKYI